MRFSRHDNHSIIIFISPLRPIHPWFRTFHSSLVGVCRQFIYSVHRPVRDGHVDGRLQCRVEVPFVVLDQPPDCERELAPRAQAEHRGYDTQPEFVRRLGATLPRHALQTARPLWVLPRPLKL